MKENKTRMLILSLVLVIVVLLGVIIYSLIIKPTFTGYTTGLRNEGVVQGSASTIFGIMQQASQCQPVSLTFGDQTMNVIWVDCLPPEFFQ